VDDARMIRALTIFKEYLSYVNKDHPRLDWDKAIQRVIDGQAAFSAMGDWADGEFRLAGLDYGKDYGAILVPATKGMYGVTLDAFVQPFGLEDPTDSERWLRLVASPEGQDAFNVVKGSIPARLDANMAGYAAYQRSAMADFKAATVIYPGAGVGTPIAYKTQFDKIIPAFAVDLDVNRAASALVAATHSAAGQYTRVWSLR
jgi:glucose/mannose transport system substrate-binding protein